MKTRTSIQTRRHAEHDDPKKILPGRALKTPALARSGNKSWPFLFTAGVVFRSNVCKYLIGHRQAREFIESEHLPALRRARSAVAAGLVPAQQVMACFTRTVAVRLDRPAPAIIVKRDDTSMSNGAAENSIHGLRPDRNAWSSTKRPGSFKHEDTMSAKTRRKSNDDAVDHKLQERGTDTGEERIDRDIFAVATRAQDAPILDENAIIERRRHPAASRQRYSACILRRTRHKYSPMSRQSTYGHRYPLASW